MISSFFVRLASVGAIACLAAVATAQTTLYDTGIYRPCIFNGASTNLGWTSGNVSAAQPQRWAAQPFTLPAGTWNITEIAPEYFIPAGNPTDMGWTIWSRNGSAAPTAADEITSGTTPFVAASSPFPVNVTLTGGDYYLSIYAYSPQGNTVGWFTNAQNGIHLTDALGVTFMWRASAYPSPGFAVYQLAPAVLSQSPGLDPNKLYCASFALRGYAAPVTYCTAGVTADGCVASISGTGNPDANAGSGFTIAVTNVEGGEWGMLFYGISGIRPHDPWGTSSSFLCVRNPVQRTGLQHAGGSHPGCDGNLALDWNAYIASNPTAIGVPFVGGETVWAQGWFRDTLSVKTTSLSDALMFVVSP